VKQRGPSTRPAPTTRQPVRSTTPTAIPKGHRSHAQRHRHANRLFAHYSVSWLAYARKREVVQAFLQATKNDDIATLIELLDPRVRYRSNGGRLVPAARNALTGFSHMNGRPGLGGPAREGAPAPYLSVPPRVTRSGGGARSR
jgi:hypothetical protein